MEVNREDIPPKTDWIFFSSPSGFELFLDHFGFQKNTRIGVLGVGTADKMKDYGLFPDFLPTYTDPEEAIKSFCDQLDENESVLVPRSEISLQRFLSALPPHQLVDWPFYTNHPSPPKEASEADYLIFTSPSNALAYFGVHKLNHKQVAVAIGNSTFSALGKSGITRSIKSEAPTEEGIWEAITKYQQEKFI